jgi:cyclase
MIWHRNLAVNVVVAIDAKQIDGRWIVHLVGGKCQRNYLFDWAKKWNKRGREILFTSMDNDGTKNGFANEALRQNFRVWSIFL